MVKADGQRDKATEERILDAAHSVFVHKGTSGARMQAIAEQAGVNKALLHYYFRSKDQLANAVFRRAAVELFPAVLEILGGEAELEEKVGRVIELELTLLSKRPYLPAYILGEINHQPERVPQFIAAIVGLNPDAIRPRLFGKVREQIAARVAAGTIAPIAPEEFVINLLSLCIFPFAARPMLIALAGLDENAFEQMIERRKKTLPSFFVRALRP